MNWRRIATIVAVVCHVAVTTAASSRLAAPPIQFTHVGTIPGPADWVEVRGKYAFVAAGPNFTAFDISDPAAPKQQGTYAFPERIWGFTLVDNMAFVAADLFGLGILDIRNPASLSLRGAVKTPGQAKSVALVGTTALVTDHVAGLDVIDVANPAAPRVVESYYLEGYARDVVTSGSRAYAVDAPMGLYTFDLSRPGPLTAVSDLQDKSGDRSSPLHPSISIARDAATAARAIVCVVRTESLHFYDVSNPAKPVKASTYRTPSGRPQRAFLRNDVGYVADGPEGVVVLDLADPSKPTAIGHHKTPSAARDLTVADSLIFVVIGDLRRDSRSPSGKEVLILRQMN
jgi:hypothetical protein